MTALNVPDQRDAARLLDLRAFTLTELLTVMAILLVLLAMLVPGLQKTREAARSTQCLGNLRSLAGGLLSYTQENEGIFPFREKVAWDAAALSMLDNNESFPPSYRKFLKCPSDKGVRTSGAADQPRSYSINPVLNRYISDYALPPWTNDVTPETQSGRRLVEISKPNQMIMLLEAFSPNDATYNNGWGGSNGDLSTLETGRHGNAANFAFCDGHIEKLTLSDTLIRTKDPVHQELTVFQAKYLRLNN